MMQRLITKREKLIFYLTISVVIFALTLNTVIIPLLAKNEQLDKKIAASSLKLAKYKRLLNQKEYLEGKYNLNSGNQLTSTFAELENLAENTSIRIIDMRPEYNSSTEVILDIKAEGSQQDFLKFIYALENSLSLFRIKKFRLTTKPNSQLLEGTFLITGPSFNK